MSTKRENVVKVRFTECELAQIDENMHRSGFRNRAGYLRQRSLGASTTSCEIARAIGKIGLTLNAQANLSEFCVDLLRADLNLLIDIISDLRGS